MKQKTDVIGTCKECSTEDCYLYDGLCDSCFEENEDCQAPFHIEYVDMGCPFCDEVNTFNVPEPDKFKCKSCGRWVHRLTKEKLMKKNKVARINKFNLILVPLIYFFFYKIVISLIDKQILEGIGWASLAILGTRVLYGKPTATPFNVFFTISERSSKLKDD